MGSSEEQPSSPSQSLLSKPYLDSPQPDPPEESDQDQYFHITYNHGPRQFKDLPFLILFSLFVLATFALGIFAIVNRNPNSSNVSSFSYDSNSTSCVKSSLSYTQVRRNSGLFVRSSSLTKGLIWTLVITSVLSFPFGLFLLLLLKRYTKQIVYIAMPFFVIMPIFFNIYWFVACTISSTCSDDFPLVYRILLLVFVFLIIGVIVWIIVVNWHRVELTIQIISVSSDALSRNLGLLGVLPCLTVALAVYYAPIIVFLVFARLNGNIMPEESSGEYYCVWKQDSWVPAYYTLAILTMLWSATAMIEAQVYVISGTISQWYFNKDDSAPRRSIRSSLRNALGPSSGTICLSGLLVCVIRIVRAAVDSARRDAPGMLNILLRCCVNALLASVDFLNKFTINFVAITGEGYCPSAKMTYELLKRNLLSAVFVETVSTRMLAGIIFVLSAVYAIAACAILQAVSNLGVDSYFVAVLAWVLLIVILGFFVHVLDNVIDTVYICYAIDRDNGEVCKQEVHEVYARLPVTRNHRSFLPTRTPGV